MNSLLPREQGKHGHEITIPVGLCASLSSHLCPGSRVFLANSVIHYGAGTVPK
jgi:hypothetical protein